MQACNITMTTSTDEEEFTFSRLGEMELSLGKVVLRYREENAWVLLTLENGQAIIDRQGDYALYLVLKEGESTKGLLGIGGNQGELETITHKVAYSLRKDSLLLSLQYDLHISGEIQKMKLRLLARRKGERR